MLRHTIRYPYKVKVKPATLMKTRVIFVPLHRDLCVYVFQRGCIDQQTIYNLISSSLLSSGLPLDGGDWLRACSADICNTASVPGKPSSAAASVFDLSVSGGSAISNNLIKIV